MKGFIRWEKLFVIAYFSTKEDIRLKFRMMLNDFLILHDSLMHFGIFSHIKSTQFQFIYKTKIHLEKCKRVMLERTKFDFKITKFWGSLYKIFLYSNRWEFYDDTKKTLKCLFTLLHKPTLIIIILSWSYSIFQFSLRHGEIYLYNNAPTTCN